MFGIFDEVADCNNELEKLKVAMAKVEARLERAVTAIKHCRQFFLLSPAFLAELDAIIAGSHGEGKR